MKTVPKLLPWLARSAGLTDLRSEQLWWEASRYARNATAEFDTPRYWKAAMERLMILIEAESAAQRRIRQASPWGVAQAHLRDALLTSTDLMAQMSANLRRWFRRPNGHAA